MAMRMIPEGGWRACDVCGWTPERADELDETHLDHLAEEIRREAGGSR